MCVPKLSSVYATSATLGLTVGGVSSVVLLVSHFNSQGMSISLINGLRRYIRCLLLCGMHEIGEGSGWMSEDRQPWGEQDGPLL